MLFSVAINPGVSLTSFTQTQMNNTQIQLVQIGNSNAPSHTLQVSDTIDTKSFAATITFVLIPTITITLNQLTIKQNIIDNLTSANMQGSVSNGLPLTFVTWSIQNDHFILNGNQIVTNFTLQQLSNNQVQFSADKTINPPNYSIKAYDDSDYSSLLPVTVTFIISPTIIVNNISIEQSASVHISNKMINGIFGLGFSVKYYVSNVLFSHFERFDSPNIAISSFRPQDIENNQIVYIQNGSSNVPSFTICISDGSDSSCTAGNITFVLLPLRTNDISIKLIFFASNVINNPGTLIFMFLQQDVAKKQVFFIHDGGLSAPFYQIAVSNRALVLPSQTSIITFINPKGICGLNQISEVNTNEMLGLDLTADNNYLIAALSNGIVQIFDIQNTQGIQLLKQIDLLSQGIGNLNRVKIVDNYAFVTSNDKTLAIISLNPINNPLLIGVVGGNRTIYDLDICNNHSYLAGGSAGVHIISLFDRRNPKFITSLNVNNSEIISVTCTNSTLLLLSNEKPGKVYIYNISNAESPTFITTQVLSDTGHFIVTKQDGTVAFAATNSGIDIIDLSNVPNCLIVSSIQLGMVYYLTLTKDEVYIGALKDASLSMINVQSIYDPIVLDSLVYSFGLNELILNSQVTYGFISSNDKLEVFSVFKADQYCHQLLPLHNI